MKKIYIALVASTLLATPSLAAGLTGGGVGINIPSMTYPDVSSLDNVRLEALCGFWRNAFGNCTRLAERDGISVDQAREVGRRYNEGRGSRTLE